MKIITQLCICLLTSLPSFAQVQTGKASYYADKFEGKPTASGEKYRHNKLTAAHRTLPFGTKVKVTNLDNDKTVEVIINDRGPFIEDRIIDLSKSAAERLGFVIQGLANVKIEVLDAGDGKGGGPIKPVSDVVINDKSYYHFQVNKTKPMSGFGVQVGTYQEMISLIRLVENLKSSYQKKVIVQVKMINDVRYYSVILGKV
ncbi:MAG TPA: septal ring lytic transglycosylase RlpA family protein, partial [Cyclobacteriaceae bacterium]|nr:septal ring lytic transglycosylase RlpA family protein [Cyclobacteriaceae bacterium]